MKVIISAGGTGGHIYPALAIINKLQKEEKKLQIKYIGTHNRMEKDIIPNEKIDYEELEIYGFNKRKWLRNIKNIYLVIKAYNKALKIIDDFKPDIVIGVGGYVTFPVIKAANKRNIKVFIHEQNSIPGKTNLLIAKYASVVGVSFKQTMAYFKNSSKVVETGNPCGERALKLRAMSKTKLGLTKDKRLVVIVAGSLGSHTINDRLKDFLLNASHEKYEILYITGAAYYDTFTKLDLFPNNVKVIPYLDNLAALLKVTDVLVSRAGASTISEILALELPSILIPSPYVVNNHQYYNALELVENDAGLLITEDELTSELLKKEINKILYDQKRYKTIKSNLKNITNRSSSEQIYKIIKELVNEK